jgi:hypothetical protein
MGGKDILQGIAGAGLVVAGIFAGGNPQLIMAGGSLVAGSIADALTQQRKMLNRVREIGENRADPSAALPVVYGEQRVGINKVFVQSGDRTSGDPNNTTPGANFYLYIVGALCHGPVYGVHEIYLDGNLALDADQHLVNNPEFTNVDYTGNDNHKGANDGAFVAAWVAYGTDGQLSIEPKTNPGGVSRIDLVVGADGSNLPQLTIPGGHNFKPGDVVYLTGALRLTNNVGYSVQYVPSSTTIQLGANYAHGSGTETATVDYYTPDMAALFPSQWSHQHNGRGVCYLILRLRYDQAHFPNGLPKVEAVVRGRALHDPRNVTTLSISRLDGSIAFAIPPYSNAIGLTPTQVTTTGAHGRSVGDVIVVSGCSQPWFNGRHRVGLIVSGTQFICFEPAQTSGTATGSIDVLTSPTTVSIASVQAGLGINYANVPFQAPTQITTSAPHGLVTNDLINISGYSLAWLNGNCRVAEVQSTTTFTVFITSQSAGTGGTINFLPQASNPVLAMRDFLLDDRYGCAAVAAEIDDTNLEVEANYCDQTIAIPNADPGVGPLQAGLIECNVGGTTGQTTMTFKHSSSPTDYLSGALITGDTFQITGENGSGPNGFGPQHVVTTVNSLALVSIYRANGTLCGPVNFSPGISTGGSNPSAAVKVTGNLGLIGDYNLSTQNILVGNQVGGTHQFVMSCSGVYRTGDTIFINGYSLSAANGTFTIQNVSPVASGTYVNLDLVSVTMNPGSTGSGGTIQRQTTQRQYMINGALDCSKTVKQNIDDVLSSYRAMLIWQGGLFRTWTRRAVTATGFILTEDTIIGDMSIRLPGQREMANIVRAAHSNRRKNYQYDATMWPDPLNTAFVNTFLANDNGQRLIKDIELPLTNEHYMAQTIAMIVRRESRTQITAGLTATEYALQFQIGDIIGVTHSTPGWVNQPFWVQQVELLQNNTVRLMLLMYDANAYVLDQFFDSALPSRTRLNNPLLVCDPPTNLAVTHVANALAVNLVVTWTPSIDQNIDHYEVQYEKTTDTAWTAWGRVSADINTVSINGVDPTVNYNIQVRAVNDAGADSDWVQVLNFSPQSPSASITLPTFSTTIQTEAGVLDLSEPVIILSWTTITNAYYSHVEVSVTALGGLGSIGGNAVTGPIRINARWNTQYTILPSVVSINGTITVGSPITVTTPNSQQIPRNLPFSDSGFAPRALDPTGTNLDPNVKGNDGANNQNVPKGVQRFTVAHGATITYAPNYQLIPLYRIIGGIQHEPRSVWGTQAQVLAQSGNTAAFSTTEPEYDDSGLDNQTTSGATVRALLRQPGGAPVNQSADFANPNSTSQGSYSAAVGLGSNVPAYNDTYTVNWKVVATTTSNWGSGLGTGDAGPFTITVQLSTNGGSSWATVATTTINPPVPSPSSIGTQITTTGALSFVQSGLSSANTNQVRIRVDPSGSGFVYGPAATATIHGDNPTQDSIHGVTWQTATSTQYASKTPNSGDTVTVEVYTT